MSRIRAAEMPLVFNKTEWQFVSVCLITLEIHTRAANQSVRSIVIVYRIAHVFETNVKIHAWALVHQMRNAKLQTTRHTVS